MKYIISQSQLNKIQENFNSVITEMTYRDLPQNVKSAIDSMNLPVDDTHIKAEKTQEPDAIYPDTGGIDPTAKENLKKLLSDLYSEFPNAPKGTNPNCDNIKGCLSGYRGYKTQASVFSGKVGSKTASGVAQRQKYSALPGFSQHSTGKTFDILSLEPSWWNTNKDIRDWVKKNACVYGFEISYPTDGPLRKQEDWHIYFTGNFCSSSKKKLSNKEVDQYYSSTKTDEKFEKQTLKDYKKSNCKASSNYTESPTVKEIINGEHDVIRLGHMGDTVAKIQELLQKYGYDLGRCGIDGLFGPKTKEAVEKFQKDFSLPLVAGINLKTIETLIEPPEEILKSLTTKIKDFSDTVIQKLGVSTNKKDSKEKTTGAAPKGSYSESKDNEYLVYVPNNYKGGQAHVLFAGANSYRGGSVSLSPGFYGKGVDPIKNKIIVVITHWNNSVPRVQDYISKKYGAKITSVAGFSKGGRPLWDYVGPKSNMKFVGLIDPSPEGEGSGVDPYIDLDFGNNTVMVANWKNWGDKPPGFVPSKVLKWYCDHRNDSKYRGKVECTDSSSYDHSAIFSSFYSKFAGRI